MDILEQPRQLLRDINSVTVDDLRQRVAGPNRTIFPQANYWNISAALGLNGAHSNLPVGGFEGNALDSPVFVHTSIALLSPIARLGFAGYYAAGYPKVGADMPDLKTYLTAAAMWDPFGVNLTAAVEEFVSFVYSPPAAAGVMGYVRTMEVSFRENDKSFDYKGYTNVKGAIKIVTIWNAVHANRTLVTCGQLLKGAEAVAATQWHRDNVRHRR